MAQSSSHMSFACLQMPDELSALIQSVVRERVRRNWPLVRAFEIRSGRRSLQQGEFVAVMPRCTDGNTLSNPREPLWLGKGASFLGSGAEAAEMRIQWLQYTPFRGKSCWMQSLSDAPVPKPFIVTAGFNLTETHLPTRLRYSQQFTPACSLAPLTYSMPPSVLHLLASACESARAGYSAEFRCWICLGVTARQLRHAAALRHGAHHLGLESDLLAESSMFVAESDGCPSQFAFSSQP